MRRLLIVTLIAVLSATFADAKLRDKQEIYTIVNYWLKEHNVSREIAQDANQPKPILSLQDSNATEESNDTNSTPLLSPLSQSTIDTSVTELGSSIDSNNTIKNYEIIKLKPKGWIIVSKVKIAHPVLGYSFESNATPAFDTPEEFQAWLDSINETLNEAKKDIGDTPPLLARASDIGTFAQKGPLLRGINWAQNYPYNKYIPHRYLVGCVATAFSQIMAYYRWPKRGVGSHSFTYKGERFGANFNTNYNWDNSSNSKAKISYHVGVAFDMKYGSTISSTWPSPTRLQRVANAFGYIIPPLERKSNYASGSWHKKIKQSIDRGHPVYYQGQSSGRYGHAFVCDGYSYENGTRMYHFNWGWKGAYNGWFTIEPVSGYSLMRFPDQQRAIFNIRPNRAFNPPTTNTKSQNSTTLQTKAKIVSPFEGKAIFSKYLKVKIDRNKNNKVQLLIFSKTLNRYIYNKYLRRNYAKIKIPTTNDTLTIKLYTYDRYKNLIGTESITVFKLPKNQTNSSTLNKSKKAILIYPKNNQEVANGYILVKWKRNQAYTVKLISYSYGLKSCLYNGFVSANSKYIYIPKNSGKTFVGVYTIDKNGKNSYISYIFLEQRNIIGSTNVAKIISPKNKDIISNKKIIIKIQKNSAYKTKLLVYSYNKKRYIFKKTTREKYIKLPRVNSDDTLFVNLTSIDKKGNVIGDHSIFLFTQSPKLKLNLIVNPKNNPYIAKLLTPKNNQILDKSKVKITFKKQKAYKIQLRVYSYSQKKFIYNRFVKKAKVIKLSKKDKTLVAQLISYNKKGIPTGYTYRYFFVK